MTMTWITAAANKLIRSQIRERFDDIEAEAKSLRNLWRAANQADQDSTKRKKRQRKKQRQ